MKKDPRFIDDSWVYSSRDPLRLKKRSPLGASSSQGDTYTKEFNPALDVSRIIGKQGDRVVYENNGLLVNWRYL